MYPAVWPCQVADTCDITQGWTLWQVLGAFDVLTATRGQRTGREVVVPRETQRAWTPEDARLSWRYKGEDEKEGKSRGKFHVGGFGKKELRVNGTLRSTTSYDNDPAFKPCSNQASACCRLAGQAPTPPPPVPALPRSVRTHTCCCVSR